MWTAEAQEALDKVKELLTKASILVPPTKKEPLLLYIAATTHVVSAALVVEREEVRHALKMEPLFTLSMRSWLIPRLTIPKSKSSCTQS
jgi:dsDNA-binding SOS-regulon protein